MIRPMQDTADVVIVGARCAGSAAAIALASRGRRVIALDRASFPSDTLSTHLLFPCHWQELAALGLRHRIAAIGAPMHTRAGLGTPEVEVEGEYPADLGPDPGSCVRRPAFDLALVEAAREAGAEVREGVRVTDLVRDGAGRVVGVRWHDGATEGTITAPLVVGADGRSSFVARAVGAEAHHEWPNHRLMAYAYYDDPRSELRHLAMQWRVGDELSTVFPCDGGQSVILLMSPVRRAEEFRADPIGTFERTVASIGPLAARVEGCRRVGRVRLSVRHPSYFRYSHGPGWALAGDSGHFKDPVTAQGIRDALRFGRLLGEAVAPVLNDEEQLASALARWEADRDRQCLAMYQWANGLGLDDDVSPVELAAYRWFAARPDGAGEILSVFSRARAPQEVFTPARTARWVAMAARDPGTDRRRLASVLARDIGREVRRRLEAARFDRVRAAGRPDD